MADYKLRYTVILCDEFKGYAIDVVYCYKDLRTRYYPFVIGKRFSYDTAPFYHSIEECRQYIIKEVTR